MKINVEVDCTPEEARQSLGLPDLRPIQDAVLGAMQQQMLDAVARSSPDVLLRTWMPLFTQGSEQMQQAMAAFFRGLSPTGGAPTGGAPTGGKQGKP